MLKLIEKDITGGKISIERIDSIGDSKSDALEISGLRQDTFEYLIKNYGERFKKIKFWKCPRVENLCALENLKNIEELVWYWNQKATSFWDLSKNKKLWKLHFKGFNKIKTFDGLNKSKSLKEFVFEDSMWGKSEVETLEPLTEMRTLEVLELSSKIRDGKLEPITRIKNLKEFYYPSNKFSTEKYAWLAARTKGKIKSNVTVAYRDLGEGALGLSQGENPNVLVTGKRKPFLDKNKNKERFEKYVNQFELLVSQYVSDPKCEEPK